MKNESEWWEPDQLVATEERVRIGSRSATPEIYHGDFGAYGALVGGADPVASRLYLHNEFVSWRIATLCADYSRLVLWGSRDTPERIADLGCGAGFTTNGLKQQWSNAHIVGFDVSHDAVVFARRHWSTCEFVQGVVRPDTSLAGGPFDVILCQEFYPFTRTAVASDHMQWLELVCRNLSARGVGIVTVSAANRHCINSTFPLLRNQFNLRRVDVVAPRLARRLPFFLSRAAGSLLRFVRPAWVRSIYVVRKSS